MYIELVIIDNFFITLLLALMSYKALSLRVCRVRLLVCAFVGTAAAVTYPFINIHFGFLILMRVGLGVILSLILFAKKGKLFLGFAVFMFFTFVLGGVIFAIGIMIHGDYQMALTVPVSNIPPGIVLFAVWLLYFAIKKGSRKVKKINDAKNFVFRAEIEIFNKKYKGDAFIDTGNRLYDTQTNLPIVVVGYKMSMDILGDENFKKMLQGKLGDISQDARFIYYGGLNDKKN